MTIRVLSDSERLDWLRLTTCENVGPVTFAKLLHRFGSAAEALSHLPQLSRRGGSDGQLRLWSRDEAQRALDRIIGMNARLVGMCEPDYPRLLRHIDDAPPLLCIKGRHELLNRTNIAMVGSRNASAAGLNFTRKLASDLAGHAIVCVSGLARGIDTAAHRASLETGTIAVVAGGIDIFYPPENAELQNEIFKKGIVVSEMLPGTRPQARHFPRRNRIISGLSYGTVIIEAAVRSGSLITARLAAEQNREVFAVPGSPLDPRASGTNKLIKHGATLVTSASDILEVVRNLNFAQTARQPSFFETGSKEPFDQRHRNATAQTHQRIVSLLSPTPTAIDELLRETGIDIDLVQSVLLELELAGRLQRHPGQLVSLI